MPRRRRPRLSKPLWFILVVIAIGFQAWRGVYEDPPVASRRAPKASQQFEVLHGARLHDDENNDGDSFKVLHQGQVHVFRLYFADCPEKSRHPNNADRLKDQGRYFGGLTETRTVAIGQQAQRFTTELLRSQPFTIHTKWHGVYDSGRYYAFVIFGDGEDLSAKVVREGLARIHTSGSTLPDGREASLYEKQLRQLEAAARAARRGAWGGR